MYAAFLDEASTITGNKELLKISDKLTKSGDLWRDSALLMSGIYKGRLNSQKDYDDCANLLNEISKLEKEAFKELSKIKI